MTVKSKLYYWLECDGTGCLSRCPNDSSDVSAWADESSAVDSALDYEDWVTVGGKHFCWDCRQILLEEASEA